MNGYILEESAVFMEQQYDLESRFKTFSIKTYRKLYIFSLQEI